MAKKKGRDKIRMVSPFGTGYFKTTDKNKKTMTGKFVKVLFDPVVRKRGEFKEAKI